jgi:hypothetical protein
MASLFVNVCLCEVHGDVRVYGGIGRLSKAAGEAFSLQLLWQY